MQQKKYQGFTSDIISINLWNALWIQLECIYFDIQLIARMI